MSRSKSAKLFLSASRTTGTTSPRSVPTATPMSQKLFWMKSSSSMRPLTTGTALSASTHALIKNDIKPSLTLFFFVNFSCDFARNSCTALRSHSLKVVRMAAVCCAITNFADFYFLTLRYFRFQHASLFRDDLGGNFVGFEGEKCVPCIDEVARFLVPDGDDTAGDRFADCGDFNFNGHVLGERRELSAFRQQGSARTVT